MRLCKIDGCNNPSWDNGKCTEHMKVIRNALKYTNQTCSVDGCERTGNLIQGMCSKHYMRQHKNCMSREEYRANMRERGVNT